MKTLLKDELPQGRFWNKAWSLVEGCTPISPGCANCWLAGLQNRNLPNMAKGLINPGSKHFNGLIKCHEDRLDIPLHRRKPTVYAIWSDLFHEGVDEWFRRRAFNRMCASEQHNFVIVTKRPHIAVKVLHEFIGRDDRHLGFQKWPLPNVTILVTMEDQQRADERAPDAHLLAAMGWRVGALCEPLLGPVDLSRHLCCNDPIMPQNAFDWIITGGESGSKARPAHPEWFRSIRDQATKAGVPFMLKSKGKFIEAPPIKDWKIGMDIRGLAYDGRTITPSDRFDPYVGDRYLLRVKDAGRILDGREHLEVPE